MPITANLWYLGIFKFQIIGIGVNRIMKSMKIAIIPFPRKKAGRLIQEPVISGSENCFQKNGSGWQATHAVMITSRK